MRKSTALSLLLLVVAVPRLSFASEPFDFVSDVIRGLLACKIADEHIKATEAKDLVSRIKDILVFTNGIRQADSMIAPYRNSKNEPIQKSADSFSAIYSSIVANNKQLVSFLEQTFNDPEEAASKQGTWLRKLSENMARNEELWLILPLATTMSTYSLVDKKRTENGELRFLTITTVEREQLRSQLHDAFGDPVRGGWKAGQLPVDASAALLRGFLAQEWKPADTK